MGNKCVLIICEIQLFEETFSNKTCSISMGTSCDNRWIFENRITHLFRMLIDEHFIKIYIDLRLLKNYYFGILTLAFYKSLLREKQGQYEAQGYRSYLPSSLFLR